MRKEKKILKLKKKNSSLLDLLSRRMIYYPSIYHHSITVALCFDEEKKKAELVKEVMKEYIDKQPEHRKKMLLALYKEMSPEQRKYPYKTSKERV